MFIVPLSRTGIDISNRSMKYNLFITFLVALLNSCKATDNSTNKSGDESPDSAESEAAQGMLMLFQIAEQYAENSRGRVSSTMLDKNVDQGMYEESNVQDISFLLVRNS